MATEIEKNRAELELLQLQELREAAEQRRSARASQARQRRTVAMALQMTLNAQRNLHSRCAHKKGGKNLDQFFDGNDSNYAVIKHTLSHGPTIVLCQRCQNLWEAPAQLHADASPAQIRQWEDEMRAYRAALALPTDNEPSGAVLFDFHPINSPVQMQHA